MDSDFKKHSYFSESMRRKNLNEEFNNVRGKNCFMEIQKQSVRDKKQEKASEIRAAKID